MLRSKQNEMNKLTPGTWDLHQPWCNDRNLNTGWQYRLKLDTFPFHPQNYLMRSEGLLRPDLDLLRLFRGWGENISDLNLYCHPILRYWGWGWGWVAFLLNPKSQSLLRYYDKLTQIEQNSSKMGCTNLLREHETCINHDVTIIIANQHAIHANLPKPTDRKNSQRRALFALVKGFHLPLHRIVSTASCSLVVIMMSALLPTVAVVIASWLLMFLRGRGWFLHQQLWAI